MQVNTHQQRKWCYCGDIFSVKVLYGGNSNEKEFLQFKIIISPSFSYLNLGWICFYRKTKEGVSQQNTNTSFSSYCFSINNFALAVNNSGVLADIIPSPLYQPNHFLYSNGFFILGIIGMGTPQQFVWSNGVATSSRILDYLPGPVRSNPSDLKNKFYILSADDSPIGVSWQEWKNAVSL